MSITSTESNAGHAGRHQTGHHHLSKKGMRKTDRPGFSLGKANAEAKRMLEALKSEQYRRGG